MSVKQWLEPRTLAELPGALRIKAKILDLTREAWNSPNLPLSPGSLCLASPALVRFPEHLVLSPVRGPCCLLFFLPGTFSRSLPGLLLYFSLSLSVTSLETWLGSALAHAVRAWTQPCHTAPAAVTSTQLAM